jgi:hypothetical protein
MSVLTTAIDVMVVKEISKRRLFKGTLYLFTNSLTAEHHWQTLSKIHFVYFFVLTLCIKTKNSAVNLAPTKRGE